MIANALTVLRALSSCALVIALAATAEAQTVGFVYAVAQVALTGTSQIYGFRLDVTSGALTPLPGFPISSGGRGQNFVPEHMVYRNGRLFVLNDAGSAAEASLAIFAVNRTTGSLTPVPFSPITVNARACVAVHPSGSPVVVGVNVFPYLLASFNLSATSATAAPNSPYSAGTDTVSCAFSRDGDYFYTAGGVGTSIAGYSVAPNGALSALPGSLFASGTAPLGLALDLAGRVFLANSEANQVRAFTTAAGIPAAVTGNPFTSGLLAARFGILHRAGFYLVADYAGNRVGVYSIAGSGAATTLTAVSGSPFAAGGIRTEILAVSPDGGLVVAANGNSRNLTVFRMDTTTGGLLALGTQPVDTLGTTGVLEGLAIAPAELNVFDRDVDTKADLGLFRPSTGAWWTLRSSTNFTTAESSLWGFGTDIPVPGDYDGDRKADVAIYRPSDSVWWILKSGSGDTSYVPYSFGASGDIPVPGDYDGDLKTDVAVFRPSTGVWWILQSTSNFTTHVGYAFGSAGDVPAPVDFDGDAQTDLAFFRPSNGTWYVLKSSALYRQYTPIPWGAGTDVPVPGDYDGDGKADVAVYRPSTGTWWVLFSGSDYATFTSYVWGGAAGDIMIPADYDGDGRTDVAFYRPASGAWAIRWSSTNYTTFSVYVWGASGDIPLPRR